MNSLNGLSEKELKEFQEDLQTLKTLLEGQAIALLDRENKLGELVRDSQKWTEISQVISDLRKPVAEIRFYLESAKAKIETLIDQNQLRDILDEAIKAQNQSLNDYLFQANESIAKRMKSVQEPLREVIDNNNVLIKQFSDYLATLHEGRRGQMGVERKVNLALGMLLVAAILPPVLTLTVLYSNPPMAPKHERVLEKLHQRLFPN